MRSPAAALALGLLTAGGAAPAAAQFRVVPTAQATVEGGSDNRFPFDPDLAGQGGPGSMRYQQVFAAAEFAGLAGPLGITELGFRPDAQEVGARGLSGQIADLEIRLSTTSRAPDGLAATFSTNVGADDTLVFRGAVAFSESPSQPPGPAPFVYRIPLQTTFSYDPALGNLLLDVRNHTGGVRGSVDAQNTPGDGTSRLLAFGVTEPSGAPDSLGLVVRFALPEPGPAPVSAAAVGALAALARRVRRTARAG